MSTSHRSHDFSLLYMVTAGQKLFCVLVYLPVIVKYKVAFQILSPLAFLHVSILIQFFHYNLFDLHHNLSAILKLTLFNQVPFVNCIS